MVFQKEKKDLLRKFGQTKGPRRPRKRRMCWEQERKVEWFVVEVVQRMIGVSLALLLVNHLWEFDEPKSEWLQRILSWRLLVSFLSQRSMPKNQSRENDKATEKQNKWVQLR
jgi:hypothetical protein